VTVTGQGRAVASIMVLATISAITVEAQVTIVVCSVLATPWRMWQIDASARRTGAGSFARLGRESARWAVPAVLEAVPLSYVIVV
jgi:hypothetical protein